MVAESVTWEEEDFQEKIMLMAEYRAGSEGVFWEQQLAMRAWR